LEKVSKLVKSNGMCWVGDDQEKMMHLFGALLRNHTKHFIVGNIPTLTSCKKKKSRTETNKDL
jgi:hypothetical protein